MTECAGKMDEDAPTQGPMRLPTLRVPGLAGLFSGSDRSGSGTTPRETPGFAYDVGEQSGA